MIASDGAELAVHSAGTGFRSALLLHGFTLDHTTMLGIAGPLTRVGFEVLVPDLRGHGSSSLGTAEPDLPRLVQDVIDIAEQRDAREVTVIGHSLGAFVALAIRAEPAAQPRLHGVVAVAAMSTSLRNPLPKLGAQLFSSGVGARLVAKGMTGRLFIRTWFRPEATDLEVEQVRVVSARCRVSTRTAIGRSTRRIDLRPTFAQPGPPTLVLCGIEDRATPTKYSRQIAEAIPNAELALIPDAGHMVITERSGEVAGAIADWMNRSGR